MQGVKSVSCSDDDASYTPVGDDFAITGASVLFLWLPLFSLLFSVPSNFPWRQHSYLSYAPHAWAQAQQLKKRYCYTIQNGDDFGSINSTISPPVCGQISRKVQACLFVFLLKEGATHARVQLPKR
ncbi:uncharacterized protein YALI1_E40972g [Yarrowia lipolytica]|uniref:Uncharacterized protein n=1 Tax=Yarrowia lipolytica TaxID=4952 RepID=A0A1D8NL89_YARLL|nr:hypothetical protein YALI1_E40972g [Yarrowia lipolytica]